VYIGLANTGRRPRERGDHLRPSSRIAVASRSAAGVSRNYGPASVVREARPTVRLRRSALNGWRPGPSGGWRVAYGVAPRLSRPIVADMATPQESDQMTERGAPGANSVATPAGS